MRFDQHLLVESRNASEVIVDGGGVGPSPIGDLLTRRTVETLFGKNFASGFEKLGPGGRSIVAPAARI